MLCYILLFSRVGGWLLSANFVILVGQNKKKIQKNKNTKKPKTIDTLKNLCATIQWKLYWEFPLLGNSFPCSLTSMVSPQRECWILHYSLHLMSNELNCHLTFNQQ